MDPEKLRDYLSQGTEQRSGLCIHKKTGKVIRAMLPMHTFGHPVRLDELLKVAGDFHINLVEDAAESIGSLYHGKHTGTFGLLGVLSFNGNKTITTGGGGAILTSNREIAQKAKHLTTTAKIPHAWEYRHDEAGYNYRLPNINAALGCAQLEQVEEFIIKKRKLAHKYQKQINVEGLRHIVEPVSCRSNYWLNAIYLPNKKERNSVLEKTNKAGIKTRPVWRLINTLKMYRKAEHSELSAARKIESTIINLPSSANINVN
jgi:dTDP-4-amino-4,6-dideoxygalactose transaminase